MAEQYITCSKCGSKIQLSKAFTQEIEDKLRTQFEDELRKKEREHKRELDAKDKEFEERVSQERIKLEKQARKKAEENLSVELADLNEQLEERKKQIDDFKKNEIALRKRQRDLEEKEQSLKLEVQRKVDTETKKIREEAEKKVAEEHRLKDLEKEKQLSEMRKQIDELKRKSELTSQQAQGEVQELELEAILTQQFKLDKIEPVPKGVRGADVVQRVRDENGRLCGSIIWESKRTKSWGNDWVQKLKDDQRDFKAETAVIVSSVLPKEINRFGYYEGVWVTDFSSTIGIATALRLSLIELAHASNALQGKNEKMELIYKYLSGNSFKQRVEAIVESFASMKNDLDAEKRAMEKIWAKRESQIGRVVKNTAGLYGDLQGIIGSALPDVKILELPDGQSE